jgi:hypothetical protein
MKKNPLRPSRFARDYTPAPKLRDREPSAPLSKPLRVGVYTKSGARAVPVLKAPEPIRDETHRRWVASLPCYECRIHGYSNAAHPNSGKAKGKKLGDDKCFPLCVDRPGVLGCHGRFDRYELVSRADMPQYEADALEWTEQQRRLA